MKKSILLMLLLNTSVALAQDYFTGLTFSGALGGTSARFKVDQTLDLSSPGNVFINIPSDIKEEGSSIAGLVGIGYTYQFASHIVLAAEFTAGLTDASIIHQNNQSVNGTIFDLFSRLSAELNNDFAVLFKAGYVMREKTQIYALIGPRWGHFESTLKTSFVSTNIGNATGSAQASESGYILGLTAGLGMQHMLTEHISASLEYAYTTYGEIPSPFNVLDASAAFGSPSTVTDNPDISASSNTLLVKISYRI